MNKLLLIFFSLLISTSVFAQRFSHYNTGTLYEAFENPSQGIFIADTTRVMASNFFIPNFNTFAYLKGNAQATLKSRLFLGTYNDDALQIGQGQINRILINTNVYSFMFRILSNENGDQELGVSFQTKGNGNANVTDETIALFNGFSKFQNDTYNNVFNGDGYFESFHQLSLTYRRKPAKNFWFGVKLSSLMGIAYNKIDITQSRITFNRAADNAQWYLNGIYRSTFEPGNFQTDDIRPSFKNPGAAISLGATYKTRGNIQIQGNIKDLGFIHWSKESRVYEFGNTTTIQGLSTSRRETNTINALSRLIERYPVEQSFTTAIEGRAELAVSKKFMLNQVSYTPTAIVAKTLFHEGAAAALVNHFQINNFIATLTGAYDHNKVFNFGGQLMYKAPNVEVYLGSEQLFQSGNLYRSSRDNIEAINKTSPYSGANVYLGFSVKFGRWFERWKNSSYIPMGK